MTDLFIQWFLLFVLVLLFGWVVSITLKRNIGEAKAALGELDARKKKVHDLPRKINRSLECAAVTPIRDAPTGQVVTIAGNIEPVGKTLRAPFSKRECVFYEVVVEQYRGLRLGDWFPLIHETEAVDFYVVDDTDRALIKQGKLQSGLKAASERDHEAVSQAFQDASPDLEAYLRLRGQSSKELGMNRILRYREGVFELGEKVVAKGTAMREQSTEPTVAGSGYRGVGQRFVLGPLPGGSILISDDAELTESTAPKG